MPQRRADTPTHPLCNEVALPAGVGLAEDRLQLSARGTDADAANVGSALKRLAFTQQSRQLGLGG